MTDEELSFRDIIALFLALQAEAGETLYYDGITYLTNNAVDNFLATPEMKALRSVLYNFGKTELWLPTGTSVELCDVLIAKGLPSPVAKWVAEYTDES